MTPPARSAQCHDMAALARRIDARAARCHVNYAHRSRLIAYHAHRARAITLAIIISL